MARTPNEVREMVDEHWIYIRRFLEVHGENLMVIEKIGFHYKSAMIHGYKHGKEDKE